MENTTYSIFEFFIDLFALIICLIISIILLIRIIREKKDTDSLNIIRMLIMGIFISFSWALFWEFFYENTAFRMGFPDEASKSPDSLGLYNIGVAFMITFALTMVFYYNQWKVLYIIPFVLVIVLFIIVLASGFGLVLTVYIYGGALLVLIIMIYNSFKLRDNNLLGLCIFFIFAFLTNLFEDTIIGLIFNLIYPIFGLIFILGYFKPFKEAAIS